ncbi:MAG: hypothetical protein IKU20_02350 [Lachnospiraceae bacterium]|nr:hypothetical protein [Lachnospiraceae bacterium]
MNIRKNDGFVLIQVLVFVMVVLLFLTSLFSASVFRAKIARMRIQKEEAKQAAEVALQLIKIEIENGNSEWIESGLPKIKTTLEFESDDGEIIISIPVVIWSECEEDGISLFAEAEIGSRKETAHMVLNLSQDNELITDSNAEVATSSTATLSGGGNPDA